MRFLPTLATSLLTVSLFSVNLTPQLSAQEEETVRKAGDAEPTGEEILRLVRMSQALQDLKKLTGRLRNDDDEGKEFPMQLSMSDNVIRFVFTNPNEIINLDLNENGTKLRRVTSGNNVEMPLSLYSEQVRSTYINYEDLAMRFLYWPNAKVLDTDTVSFMKCWVVRVVNPDGRGPYATVDVWVHQGSGAIAQMIAYDVKGRKLKMFRVSKGQKYNGAWILKQMRVESFNVDTNKVKGRTYVEINDPE
jgi:hypothetical protein